MTAPPDRFGAHDRRPQPSGYHQEFKQALRKLFACHVVRVAAESQVSPCGIGGIWRRFAPPAESRQPEVRPVVPGETGLKGGLVELRMAAGSGKTAHIGDRLDRMTSEDLIELVYCPGRVTDGPDGRS